MFDCKEAVSHTTTSGTPILKEYVMPSMTTKTSPPRFCFDGDQLRRQLETALDGMFFIQAERCGKGFQLPLQGRRK
jgi:hypothetical protein